VVPVSLSDSSHSIFLADVVMQTWKRSVFTSAIVCDSGDLLLHNSFMGSVAHVPASQAKRIGELLQRGVTECDTNDAQITELCNQGFLVSAEFDERKAYREILDKERSDRLGLMILPHENCNFRCIYCYEKFKRSRMGANVINSLKRFVDRSIKNYSGLGVAWFGGEPLLGQEVIRELSESFIRSCEVRGATYSSGMSTNGYLLTPEMVDSLFQSKIKSFQICIDGPEFVHDRKRKLAGGGGTYRRIIANLLSMHNRGEDFFVSMRVNFDNESIPFLEAWLSDEIAPLLAHDPRFGMHFEPVTKRGGPNDSILDVCTPHIASATRSRLFAKALALGFSDLNVKKFLIPHGLVCYAAREAAFIVATDGSVYKCSLAFDDPRNNVGTLSADGELLLDSAKSALWTSLDGQDTTECDHCSLYGCCQSRKCPLVAIKQHKPVCPVTNEVYATLVKLVALS